VQVPGLQGVLKGVAVEDVVKRTYLSGSIKIVVELMEDEDGREYYGCDVYTDLIKYPCAVHPPALCPGSLDDEEALADAARAALSFASAVGNDVMGIADAAEIETVGKGCTIDRWRLTVVPSLNVFANHEGRGDDVWDAVEKKLRSAFPSADLWLELDDVSGDPEITIEPAGAIDEAQVRNILKEGLS